MNLADLIAGWDDLHRADASASSAGVRITDLTEDSRTIMPGSLFIARPGLTSDGRRYIHDAIRLGAAGILTDAEGAAATGSAPIPVIVAERLPLAAARVAERFFGDPSSKLRMVGITGTNGKSTVAHLTHGILNAAGLRAGLIGTIEIDDGRERARSEMTTLPAVELSRTLATMLEHGCRAAVMEVSSHALDQDRVGAISFDVGVFTMLGSDHLDYHGTIESYAAAKARLFGMLPENGLAVVNADDRWHTRMLESCISRVTRCGAHGADAGYRILESSVTGIELMLSGSFGEVEVSAPFVGEHNAMNVLQAVCAANEVGLDPDALQLGTRRLTPPPGRLERVSDASSDIAVFVDYAHTADAIEHTLSALRRIIGDGSLCVVFGCGGDRDRSKRPEMGRVASGLADRVVLTSDNPRRERPDMIISMIMEGIPSSDRERTMVHADRARAIESAILDAAPGETVVIAGKGHEREQILPDGAGGTVVRPFDDAAHARAALESRSRAAVQS